jgi:hypothetical protein
LGDLQRIHQHIDAILPQVDAQPVARDQQGQVAAQHGKARTRLQRRLDGADHLGELAAHGAAILADGPAVGVPDPCAYALGQGDVMPARCSAAMSGLSRRSNPSRDRSRGGAGRMIDMSGAGPSAAGSCCVTWDCRPE